MLTKLFRFFFLLPSLHSRSSNFVHYETFWCSGCFLLLSSGIANWTLNMIVLIQWNPINFKIFALLISIRQFFPSDFPINHYLSWLVHRIAIYDLNFFFYFVCFNVLWKAFDSINDKNFYSFKSEIHWQHSIDYANGNIRPLLHIAHH